MQDPTPDQDSETRLQSLEHFVDSLEWKINRFLECNHFVRVDKESIKDIVEWKKNSYDLGQEIKGYVDKNEVPEGYGHELLYLEKAKRAFEANKKYSDFLEQIKPYEGKKVLVSNGKVVTIKKILKEELAKLKKKKKPKR